MSRALVVVGLSQEDMSALDETAARAGMTRAGYARKAILWAIYGAPAQIEDGEVEE